MSNYEAYIGVTKGIPGGFSRSADVGALLKEHPVTDEMSVYLSSKTRYLITCHNDHSCRETLIGCTWSVIEEAKKYISYIEAAYFRGYPYEDGRFEPHIVAKINKLATIVNKGWSSVHLSTKDGVAVVGIKLYDRVDRAAVDFPLASLLFWIIRNEEILAWCARYADTNPTQDLRSLLAEMSLKFLAEEDWGDDDNENLPLSFFCYDYSNGGTYREAEVKSGPEDTAESNLTMYSMRRYVTEVAIPFLKKNGRNKTPSKYIDLDDYFIVHDDLDTEFEISFKSFLVSEWE
jgi:hypothetical protein